MSDIVFIMMDALPLLCRLIVLDVFHCVHGVDRPLRSHCSCLVSLTTHSDIFVAIHVICHPGLAVNDYSCFLLHV